MRIGGGGAKITAGSQRHVSLVQRTLAERPCIQSGTGNVEVGIERAVRLHFDRQSDALQTINYDAPTAQQLLTAASHSARLSGVKQASAACWVGVCAHR